MKQKKSNMRKRIQALGVVVLLCVMSWTVVSKADGILTEGDYQYSVLGDGTVEIEKYLGSDSSIIIPQNIEGKKVTCIGSSAFADHEEIIDVIVPDSVKSIDGYAFSDCSNLEKIVLPDKMDSLGLGAFCACSSLKEIVVPDGIKTIENDTFYGCSELKSVVIPVSVANIKSVVFVGCEQLSDIQIDKNNKTFYVEGNCIIDTSKTVVWGCKLSKIPADVKNIGEYAFCESAIESVVIPEGVISIEPDAFAMCKKLKTVSLPGSIKQLKRSAFQGCTAMENITLPEG